MESQFRANCAFLVSATIQMGYADARHGNHRKTRRDRMSAKLKEIKEELRRRMHRPIPDQGNWLRQVVDGHAFRGVRLSGEILRAVFAFIGIEDVEFMRAEGLAFGPEQRDAAIRAALAAVPAAVTQLAA